MTHRLEKLMLERASRTRNPQDSTVHSLTLENGAEGPREAANGSTYLMVGGEGEGRRRVGTAEEHGALEGGVLEGPDSGRGATGRERGALRAFVKRKPSQPVTRATSLYPWERRQPCLLRLGEMGWLAKAGASPRGRQLDAT